MDARLPANVDPLDNKLKDPIERRRIARLFDRGINEVAVYVLPLRWASLHPQSSWQSGRWAFRDGSLFLIPGDSAMGLRLPLDALPHVPEGEIERDPERNPLEPREPLHAPHDEIARRYGRISHPDQVPQRIREQGTDPAATGYRFGRQGLVELRAFEMPSARPNEPGADAAAALNGGPLLEGALHPPPCALAHRAA